MHTGAYPSELTAVRGFRSFGRLIVRIKPGMIWFDGEIHQLQFIADLWLNDFPDFVANG